MSRAYSFEVIRVATEVDEAEEAWNAAWPEAIDRHEPWLTSMHESVSTSFREKGKRAPTKEQLLEAIRQRVGGWRQFVETLRPTDE